MLNMEHNTYMFYSQLFHCFSLASSITCTSCCIQEYNFQSVLVSSENPDSGATALSMSFVRVAFPAYCKCTCGTKSRTSPQTQPQASLASHHNPPDHPYTQMILPFNSNFRIYKYRIYSPIV